MQPDAIEDAEPYFPALQTAGDEAFAALLRIVHQHITVHNYQKALSILFRMASCALHNLGTERALVVHTIAIASLLAQRGELLQATQMLRMGAPYSGDWPEREEIIGMALILTDLSVAAKDFPSAHGAVAALSACVEPQTRMHRKAIELAIHVNREEINHRARRR